jgi:hypothetical protein
MSLWYHHYYAVLNFLCKLGAVVHDKTLSLNPDIFSYSFLNFAPAVAYFQCTMTILFRTHANQIKGALVY